MTTPPAGTPDLSPEELRTGACVLSPDVVSRLGSVLEQHRPTLARELGFSLTDPVDQELRRWCRNRGSTVFVLASVLDRVGRQDCLPWIRVDMEQHMMRLHLAIESAPTSASGNPCTGGELPGAPAFQQVCTNCDFQLGHALENVLCHDLGRYEIVGPGSWITWETPAYKLRGQQLTLRYHRCDAFQGNFQGGDSTKVKQLYSGNDESTELKGHFSQRDGALDSGLTFVKGLFENGASTPSAKQTEDKERSLAGGLAESLTELKRIGGYGETREKTSAKDETLPKEMEEYETSFTEVYMDERALYPQQEVSMSLVGSHSNNSPSADLSLQREVEMGLSDSVVAHAPGTFDAINFHTLDDRYLTHGSNMTCKLPISRENIHREVSDTKTLPDKDMTKHHLHSRTSDLGNFSRLHEARQREILSRATSHPASTQGLANVPNLSLLGPCSSALDQHQDGLSLAEPSVETNMSQGELKQNNLNCISVSTAASLFRRNPLDSPIHTAMSMAERSHVDLRDISPDGENSFSNNQGIEPDPLMETSDTRKLVYVDTVKRTYVEDQVGRKDGDGEMMMDTSYALGATGENATPPSPGAARFSAVSAPPLKRQKSDLGELHLKDSPDLQTMAVNSEMNHSAALHHPQTEDQQQQSSSISQDPNLGLLPPKSNPFRYTPPPPYLGKLPQFQPPPYNSVSQASQPQTHSDHLLQSPSSQHSNSSQPLTHSSSNHSGSDRIFYSNFQSSAVRHSAPAHIQQTHGLVASSDQYMEMTGATGPALQTAQSTNINAAFPPTNPFSSSHSQSPALHLAHGVTGISGNSVHQGHQSVGFHNVGGMHDPPRHGARELPAAASSLEQPFHPSPHVVLPIVGHSNSSSMRQEHPAGNPAMQEVEHYNYINPDHVTVARGQAVARPLSLPNRLRVSLQEELLQLPGWCPYVNGDNIQATMSGILHQDGVFIIWRSRRHGKFIITVSHQRQLIYLRVQELPPRSRDGGPVYYLYENGFRTESILSLYQHYRQAGIQVPIISPQGRHHIEHIHLRIPVRVRIERMRRR